jgi:hypothetical protein
MVNASKDHLGHQDTRRMRHGCRGAEELRAEGDPTLIRHDDGAG